MRCFLAIDRNKIIATAQKYIQKGSFKKAVREYYKIIEEQPDDVRILLKIGDLQARDGQVSEAVSTYNEVSDYYVANGFFLKAIAVYKQLLRVSPNDLATKLRLADLYFQLGLPGDAVAQYQVVASIYADQGNDGAMLRTLRRIVEVDPENVSTRIKLGEQLSKNGDTQGAGVQLAAACDLLHEAGRFEEYTRVAERYLHLRPDDVGSAKRLARTYLETSRPRKALGRIQTVFRSNAYDVECLRILSEALVAVDERDRAIHALREFAGRFASDGRDRERLELLAMLLELDPTDPEALASVAPPTLDVEDLLVDGAVLDDEVSADLVEATILEPIEVQEEVDKILSETDVYLKYNLHEKSLEHLELAFALDPRSVGALERRAGVYRAQGRDADALADLTVLRDLVGDDEQRFREVEALIRAIQPSAAHGPDSTAAALAEADVLVAEMDDKVEGTEVDEASDEELTFDDFDALFDGVEIEATDDSDLRALDENELFIQEVGASMGETFAQDLNEVSGPGPVPSELVSALDRVDALARSGDLVSAHSALLECVGEWPGHAEHILATMDALPPGIDVSGEFERVLSKKHAFSTLTSETPDPRPEPTTTESVVTVQVEESTDEDDLLLFSFDEDEEAPDDAFSDADDASFADEDASDEILFSIDLDDDSVSDSASESADEPQLFIDDGEDQAGDADLFEIEVSDEETGHEPTGTAHEDSRGDLVEEIAGSEADGVTEADPASAQYPFERAEGGGSVHPLVDAATVNSADDVLLFSEFSDDGGIDFPIHDDFDGEDTDLIFEFDDATGGGDADGGIELPSPSSAGSLILETTRPPIGDGAERRRVDGIDVPDADAGSLEIDSLIPDEPDQSGLGIPADMAHVDPAPHQEPDLDAYFIEEREEASSAIDAPVGKASAAVLQDFGPSERLIASAADDELALAVLARREGNAFAVVDTLQQEIFGDHPIVASFELAVANIEMGMYFDAIASLGQLFHAPGLDEADQMLIKYFLGIAYEAMAQDEEARMLFQDICERDLVRFPDAAVRLSRL